MSPLAVTGGSGLDPKTRAVLARLCELRGSLNGSQAVKFPYLVDVISKQVLGRPITNERHETWRYGVVAPKVFRFIKYPPDGEIDFEITADEFSSARTIRLAGRSSIELVLTADEIEVIDFVADEYGDFDVQSLGALTKAMNGWAAPDQWGQNLPAHVNGEAYSQLPAWPGEDEADAEVARDRVAEIEQHPGRLVRGDGVVNFLRELGR